MTDIHNIWSWLLTRYDTQLRRFRNVEAAMICEDFMEAKDWLEKIRQSTESLEAEIEKVRNAHADDLASRPRTIEVGDVEKTVRIDTMMNIVDSLKQMRVLYTKALEPFFLRGPKPTASA